jgi:hypothetical protein
MKKGNPMTWMKHWAVFYDRQSRKLYMGAPGDKYNGQPAAPTDNEKLLMNAAFLEGRAVGLREAMALIESHRMLVRKGQRAASPAGAGPSGRD